ncbi:MJ0042-type zinc finger domain-containing protein [Sphingomonas japonica]|uniref:Zn finger-like uncharacterized protein n=1 Tax=Sphingomonas japonica TaxID=511662 RepID=A0ABX0TZM4_9SPHN|nr:MJ0042-type zinc finger domain-containing protein [Sphingomonas japonica]NIJ23290.1 putative Zn finger-like uncharacterized protein [Sphingomonas japonica]
MILECTECRNRYLVPDSAIGAAGRTVRCANCKHSWFQEPAPAAEARPAASIKAPPPPIAAAPAPPEPAPGPVADPVPPSRASFSFVDPAAIAPPAPPREFDAFAHQPPFRPRRNPARRWTAAAMIAGVSMLLGVGAILYTGAPGLASQLGIPVGTSATPLRFTERAIDRRNLSSGNELFAVSGRIENPTATTQRIPDIQAELRDVQGRMVFSWTITPPTRTLGPSAAVEFNSAKLDVPANSKVLELSFAGASAD